MATSLDHAAVNSFLRGLKYPIDRAELIHMAELNRVPDRLVEALRELPAGEFGSQQEVMDHLQEAGHNIS
ncbi:MAG: DUF2795 domain-containing protein [Chloroflexota bacterium]